MPNPIVTGNASTIAGFSSMSYDLDKLHAILALMEYRGTTYGLGSKVADLNASPPTFITPGGSPTNTLDCSGFQRYAMLHCAGLLMPDGSVNQLDFLAGKGFKHHSIASGENYTDNLAANVLYLCFCRTGSRGEGIGHIWAVYGGQNGHTAESYGGVGPGSRSPQTPVLVRIATDVFAINRYAGAIVPGVACL